MSTVDTNWELVDAKAQLKALMDMVVKDRIENALLQKRNEYLQGIVDNMQAQYWARINGYHKMLRLVSDILSEEIPEHSRSYAIEQTLQTIERTLGTETTFH